MTISYYHDIIIKYLFLRNLIDFLYIILYKNTKCALIGYFSIFNIILIYIKISKNSFYIKKKINTLVIYLLMKLKKLFIYINNIEY
jgi:hypothetical protein